MAEAVNCMLLHSRPRPSRLSEATLAVGSSPSLYVTIFPAWAPRMIHYFCVQNSTGRSTQTILCRGQTCCSGSTPGCASPVILVSAPAGFGKTTLLSLWVEQCAAPSAWLSLDEGDNDLAVFLRYVIAAVRTLFPDACVETEALTRSALTPPVAVLAHQFSNELDALPGDFVLVLDDYYVIQDTAIHELIADLLAPPAAPASSGARYPSGSCLTACQTARIWAPHRTAPCTICALDPPNR